MAMLTIWETRMTCCSRDTWE